MSTLLIGYDVECPRKGSDETERFISQALAVHSHFRAPCSLFVTGQTLEYNAEALKLAAARQDIFDIQSHTYSHCLLKTVCQEDDDGRITVFQGGTLPRIRRDVALGLRVIKDILGVDATGLTGPFGYYRGLSDRPDILRLLHQLGVRFLRCYSRNEHDWQPVALSVQPFWYAPQGFPDMLEFPIHGWQDCIWRERRGWDNLAAFKDYQVSLIDEAAGRWPVLSLGYHDWSAIREDPEMTIISTVLSYAKSRGMKITSYRHYFAELEARRLSS